MNNPEFWSSVGFWVLVGGLVGEGLVISFVPSGKLEKALAVLCTLVVIVGVAVEHIADSRRLADRTLSDGQVATIVADLKPFEGQLFQITTFWDMREPLALSNRLYGALIAAGWKYDKPRTGSFMLGGMEGVQILAHPAAKPEAKKAREELLSIPNRYGLSAVPKEQNAPNNPSDELYINVGTKPE